MANEITWGFATGDITLTFGVYTSAGVQREVGTALTETPAGSGLYLGTPTLIVAGDMVIIKQGTVQVGQGQYKPEISASAIEAKIDIIDINVDNILIQQKKVFVNTDETETTPSLSIIVE